MLEYSPASGNELRGSLPFHSVKLHSKAQIVISPLVKYFVYILLCSVNPASLKKICFSTNITHSLTKLATKYASLFFCSCLSWGLLFNNFLEYECEKSVFFQSKKREQFYHTVRPQVLSLIFFY